LHGLKFERLLAASTIHGITQLRMLTPVSTPRYLVILGLNPTEIVAEQINEY